MWCKIKSWHIIRTGALGGGWITLCGKVSGGDRQDAFPTDEKTCESCLRIDRKIHG